MLLWTVTLDFLILQHLCILIATMLLICYIRYVQSAKKCIDLCVYCITCSELADVIVRLHSLGVQVRVITDSDQLDAAGSQIGHFRMEG